jgi:hypothetical protein
MQHPGVQHSVAIDAGFQCAGPSVTENVQLLALCGVCEVGSTVGGYVFQRH